MGALDEPSPRKIHDRAIPTMGGLAIFVSFFLGVGIADLSHFISVKNSLFAHIKIHHLLLGAFPLLLAGLADDKYRINFKLKLTAQIVMALIMLYFGYRVNGITNPFNGETIPLGFLGIPLTILWLVLIVNAIDFMDGIDGLSAGISLIAFVTIFIVSLYLQNAPAALLAAIAAGSVVGFLRYNFYPASIFMGDTGSLFLGFLLAVLSLASAQKSSTAVALAIPVTILGLPIIDAAVAVTRRWSSEWSASHSFLGRAFSWHKMFYADLDHIHHWILAKGFTKREAVIILYVVAAGFGISGFILTAARYQSIALLLLYMGAVFFIAFRKFPVSQTSLADRALEPTREKNRETAGTGVASQSKLEHQVKQRFDYALIWLAAFLLPLFIFLGFVIGENWMK